MPWIWCYHFKGFGELGEIHRVLQDFIVAKSTLHVFDGLNGGQAHVRARLWVSCVCGVVTFFVGNTCQFTYYSHWEQLYGNKPNTKVPTPVEIDDMKKRIRAKHAEKLAKRRKVKTLDS